VLSREAGLAITPETSRCQWLGERMDYSMAIEGMQFLEQKAVAAPTSDYGGRTRLDEQRLASQTGSYSKAPSAHGPADT
jgi:hypothetical protein